MLADPLSYDPEDGQTDLYREGQDLVCTNRKVIGRTKFASEDAARCRSISPNSFRVLPEIFLTLLTPIKRLLVESIYTRNRYYSPNLAT
jgi:hypothetical protein